MTPDAPVVVDLIRAIVSRGRSQAWIARELAVSPCTVSRWATGQTAPGPAHLDRLRVLACRVHETPVDGLFETYLSAIRDLRHQYHDRDAQAMRLTLARMTHVETQLRAVLGSSLTKDSQDGLSASDRPPYWRSVVAFFVCLAGVLGPQALSLAG